MGNERLYNAIERLLDFCSNDALTSTISKIEYDLCRKDINSIGEYISENKIDGEVLQSALIVKKSLGQINVVIHALGIVNLMKNILDDNEVIEELSIGAGNTNRPFDLITNKRIAEFKFISWSGKQDTIRQIVSLRIFLSWNCIKQIRKSTYMSWIRMWF